MSIPRLRRSTPALLVILFTLCLGASVLPFPGALGGAGDVGTVRETLTFRNDQGNQRTRVALPADIGRLVDIVSDGSATNLWFVNDAGDLRNVTLGPGLYVLEGVVATSSQE